MFDAYILLLGEQQKPVGFHARFPIVLQPLTHTTYATKPPSTRQTQMLTPAI